MENNDLKVNETSSNGLMEFLTELGKALTASGISVVDITLILEKVAQAYNVKAEILVFPTMLLLKIGEHESAPLNAAIQKPGLLPLNQVSEIYDLIYKAEAGEISPIEGKKCLRKILSEKHKFGPLGILLGYILFSMGIGMLLQPTPEQLVVSGVLGAIVGILLIFSRAVPDFYLYSLLLQLWCPPYLGVFIFAMGMYLFMSIKNKDMPWVILILYIAFFGQQAGNHFVGGVFGAFSGSLLMTISGTIIERLDHKTPSIVSIMPAFWILVPGALGFMSLATLVSQNYFTAITDGIMVAMTIVAISLGLLIGAVITEPLKEMEII